jgi:hypothetical protein
VQVIGSALTRCSGYKGHAVIFASLQRQQHVHTIHTLTVASRCCHFRCCLQAHAEQEAATAAVAAAAAAAAEAAAEAEALAQQHAQFAAELRQREQLEKRIKQAQPQNGTARVLIADSLYQLALASREYLSGAAAGAGVSGRPAMAVMAAAFWQVPSNGWDAESAAAAADSAAGEALSSQDQEQEWWCSGPLAWKAAEERQQWQAECQAAAATRSGGSAGGAAAARRRKQKGEDGNARQPVGSEDSGEGEQQWLQGPVLGWEY